MTLSYLFALVQATRCSNKSYTSLRCMYYRDTHSAENYWTPHPDSDHQLIGPGSSRPPHYIYGRGLVIVASPTAHTTDICITHAYFIMYQCLGDLSVAHPCYSSASTYDPLPPSSYISGLLKIQLVNLHLVYIKLGYLTLVVHIT